MFYFHTYRLILAQSEHSFKITTRQMTVMYFKKIQDFLADSESYYLWIFSPSCCDNMLSFYSP